MFIRKIKLTLEWESTLILRQILEDLIYKDKNNNKFYIA